MNWSSYWPGRTSSGLRCRIGCSPNIPASRLTSQTRALMQQIDKTIPGWPLE